VALPRWALEKAFISRPLSNIGLTRHRARLMRLLYVTLEGRRVGPYPESKIVVALRTGKLEPEVELSDAKTGDNVHASDLLTEYPFPGESGHSDHLEVRSRYEDRTDPRQPNVGQPHANPERESVVEDIQEGPAKRTEAPKENYRPAELKDSTVFTVFVFIVLGLGFLIGAIGDSSDDIRNAMVLGAIIGVIAGGVEDSRRGHQWSWVAGGGLGAMISAGACAVGRILFG
jgi:hypothetical protein